MLTVPLHCCGQLSPAQGREHLYLSPRRVVRERTVCVSLSFPSYLQTSRALHAYEGTVPVLQKPACNTLDLSIILEPRSPSRRETQTARSPRRRHHILPLTPHSRTRLSRVAQPLFFSLPIAAATLDSARLDAVHGDHAYAGRIRIRTAFIPGVRCASSCGASCPMTAHRRHSSSSLSSSSSSSSSSSNSE